MSRRALVFLSAVALAGCAGADLAPLSGQTEAPAQAGEEAAATTAQDPPAAPVRPPSTARTAEEFDTTSAAERAEAVAEAAQPGAERDLGTTLASLGAVAEPGIWLKTPLVREATRGRVEYPQKGTKVAVDLIPIDGAPGSGSRLSLSAMRLLEADLTSLPELRVYATGG